MALRIVFMGTPDFAVPALQALAEAGHAVAAVYSQPPRPAGRGMTPRPSPVQRHAEAAGMTVLTPASLRPEEERQRFAGHGAEVAVVVAYGLILPPAILGLPRHGCLNIHASLLPRWRGAAPINRAVMAGDRETGVTIMRMDEGLDTGPTALRRALPIAETDTAGQLHDRLAACGAEMIVEALDLLERGKLACTPQPAEGVSYAEKIDKAEARIDWSRPAEEVDRQIRGLSPFPGAWCTMPLGGNDRVKVLGSRLAAGAGPPGTVLDEALTVACGAGAVQLTVLQRAGKGALDRAAFQRGQDLPPGTRLA